MAVPKRRTSHARRARRSHLHLKPRQNTYCGRCGNAILPHVVCWNCGWHNIQGREVVAETEEKEK